MLRGSLAAVLQSEGYRVESAANALEALTRLTRPPKPSLIRSTSCSPTWTASSFAPSRRLHPTWRTFR